MQHTKITGNDYKMILNKQNLITKLTITEIGFIFSLDNT